MAIHVIDEAGNIEWHCPHVGEKDGPCGVRHTHHISHEAIQWHGHQVSSKPEHQMVSLPRCPDCGAQTFLKVHFTEKELKAPNMWLPWNNYWEEQLQNLQIAHNAAEEGDHKNMIAQQISQLQEAKTNGGQHTPSHAMAQRHMELARQMVASGKVPG